jgi:uncharacterized protein
MAGELSWFELGVGDVAKAQSFYSSLFGWQFEPFGERGGMTITTPTIPGGVHGDDEGASPFVFFRVDDLSAAEERVRELGGAVERLEDAAEDSDAAPHGRFALCRDDQGSSFGLHEPPR